MIDYTYLINDGIAAMKANRNVLRRKWLDNTNWDIDVQLCAEYQGLEWHFTLQRRFPLHPVVTHLLQRYKPNDSNALLLEWPHIAESDPCRLAYTRDERSGKADRQTLTSVGKFIKRHWPELKDHQLRDAQTVYHPDTLEIGEGIEFLIQGIEFGPQSCMKSSYGNIPFTNSDNDKLKRFLQGEAVEVPWEKHPYSVYEARYGWKMAIRKTADGVFKGRCLLNSECKGYVRSYARGKTDADQSQTDHVIEAWLNEQGWTKLKVWPEGLKLAELDHPEGRGHLFPYIDGESSDSRRLRKEEGYFVRSDTGNYTCDHTDGTAQYEEPEKRVFCPDCEEFHVESDMNDVFGDRQVCDSCIGNYSWTTTSQGTFRMPDENTTAAYTSYQRRLSGQEHTRIYSQDVPEDYVWMADYDCYSPINYAKLCTDGVYRFASDPNVVMLKKDYGGSRYAHFENVIVDALGNDYAEEEAFREVDGKIYLEENCVKCDLSGMWYKPGTSILRLSNGDRVAEELMERVSSDAEWGDDVMGEFRERMVEKASYERSSSPLRGAQTLGQLLRGALGTLRESWDASRFYDLWSESGFNPYRGLVDFSDSSRYMYYNNDYE